MRKKKTPTIEPIINSVIDPLGEDGIIKNGLVAWYDPGWQNATGQTGQVLIDRSGRGNHAQLGSTSGADTNDPSWTGSGLSFDGVDDFCLLTNLQLTNAFTILTIIKPNTLEEWPTIISKYNGSNSNKTFKLGASLGGNNKPYLELSGNGSTSARLDCTTAVSTVNCSLVTALYNGVGGIANVFVNNNLSTSSKTGTIPSTLYQSSANFKIGSSDSGYGYTGTQHIIVIYNVALSSAKILHNYTYLKKLMASRGITI